MEFAHLLSDLVKEEKKAEELYNSKIIGGRLQNEKLERVYQQFGDYLGKERAIREEMVRTSS